MVSQLGIWFRIASFIRNDIPRFFINEWSLYCHLRVTEKVVWIDFGVLSLFKVGVQFSDLMDMAIGDKGIFVSEIPFHFIKEVNGVNELYFTASCLGFSVR